MPPVMDQDVERIQRAAAAIDPVLNAITSDQLGHPTPDDDWDLRTLLDHLIGNMRTWAARIDGAQPDAGTPPLTAANDDVAAAWRPARDMLLAAVGSPGALDREIPTSQGSTTSARFLGSILPIELMLHGWDAARSVGAATDFDPELAGELLATGRRLMEGRPRGQAFGQEQPAPAGSTAADRLAAFYGRRA
jgi:uncharacterized protein (TIGR03086 family)